MARRREKRMKKLRNNGAIDGEDRLSSLPNDLLVLILSKLKDLKVIFICSLVSKRFASMVTHIQAVCLACPAREIYLLTNPDMNFITFLDKFKNLGSIYLEFTCPRNNSYNPKCLNWIAKCATNRGITNILVCQLLDSVLNQHDGEEQENQQQHYWEDISKSADHGLTVFVRCFDCVHLLSILVQRLGSLKRVSVTDSEKQWKLIPEEEQLVMWRKSLVGEQLLDLSFVNLSWSWIALGYDRYADGRLLKIIVQPEDVGERDVKYELEF